MDKNIRRAFPPCSIFDTPKLEGWLDDMAREGWQFEDHNTFFGYYVFRKAAPQQVHYRLEVVVNPQSFWTGDAKTPREEALALHEEFGWQFVLRMGEFYLYKSVEAAPRELHTDPEVQALALKMLNKRIWKGISVSTMNVAFAIFFGAFGYPLTLTALFGTGFTLCFLLFLLNQGWNHFEAVHHTRRHRKALLDGIGLPIEDWRIGATSYRRRLVCDLCLTFGFFLFLFALWIGQWAAHPLSDFTGTIPFVTVDQVDPEGQHGTLEKINNATCKQWSDPLYPVVLDYLDGGSVEQNGEPVTAGLLEVQYMEAASPWLAHGVAKEFTRFYSRQPLGSRNLEVKPLSGLGLEYAMGLYSEHLGCLRVILAEGNRTICARFSLDDETGPYTIEHWTDLMAKNLSEE